MKTEEKNMFIFTGIAAAVMLLVVGAAHCFKSDSEVVTTKEHEMVDQTDNVVRVWMHEPGCYTYFTQDQDDSLAAPSGKYCFRASVFTDAPSDKKAWVIMTTKTKEGFNKAGELVSRSSATTYDIHIHPFGQAPKELAGAGWTRRYGKGGVRRGQTTVVE